MAIPVIMPRQGQSVESCIITNWNKAVGDTVAEGDVLFSYETDKAAFDEISQHSGVMLAILRQEGDDVPCLDNVCVIGQPGEDISEYTRPEDSAAVEHADMPAEVQTEAPKIPAHTLAAEIAGTEGSAQKVSPRAKKFAQEHGVDLTKASATGPHGRIIQRDAIAAYEAGSLITHAAREAGITNAQPTGLGGRTRIGDSGIADAYAAEQSVTAVSFAEGYDYTSYNDVPLSNIRKRIGAAMHQSLASMAQLTHNSSYDCTSLLALRKAFKENGEDMGLSRISINDIILFAVSRTLKAHPELNAHLIDDTLRIFEHVNLGMAVDTPRGLMVPTIFGADKLSLAEISVQAKELAAECIAGNISPDKLQGGSFTVSNLGSLGIESFTPVINPPQTGILGVNTIVPRVRAGKDGGMEMYQSMALSLTYDHRAVDGAPASRFLADLRRNLENIQLLLAKG